MKNKTNKNKNTNFSFLALAKARKTSYEFSDNEVQNKDVEKILEAARWSPSCSNIQPWHFVIVKDKKEISELIELSYFGDFHTEPPLIIAFIL